MDRMWKRKFLTIAIGQTVSLLGSSAVQFCLMWWLAVQTDSPLVLSLAGLVAYMPQVILGPFVGVWVDRWKKKTVVMTADLFIGLVSGGFALWFLLGEPEYWVVFAIMGVRAVGGVFHQPAIQALIPRLVPQQELMQANSWSQFMQSGAFMLGPVIGGMMYSVLPMWVILITDLAGALVASVLVWVVEIREPPHTLQEQGNFWLEFRDGLAVINQGRVLRAVLLTAFLCMVFFIPLCYLYPLMTSSYFALDSVYGSVVEFTYSLGALLISLVMGGLGRRFHKVKLVYFGLFLLGFTSLLCGVLPPRPMVYFWIFAVVCMVMGAGGNFYGIPLGSYVQETVPPEKLGRVFSLWGTVLSLAMPVGLLMSGPVSEALGVAPWFFLAGLAGTVIALVSYLLVRKKLI